MGAVLIVSIKVWRLVRREDIRVRIKRIKKGGGVETPLSVKTLTMAPGGVETSVFQKTIVPESAHVDFSMNVILI